MLRKAPIVETTPDTTAATTAGPIKLLMSNNDIPSLMMTGKRLRSGVACAAIASHHGFLNKELETHEQPQGETINRATVDRLRELARAAHASKLHQALPTNAGVAIERAAEELERAASIIEGHTVMLDGSAAVAPLK